LPRPDQYSYPKDEPARPNHSPTDSARDHLQLSQRLTDSRAEYLLQGIVEKAPALIYVKDLDGRYLLVTRHTAEVIGVDAASVLGKTVSDVYAPEQAQALAAFD
jgi:PAS domain-containing protein